MGTYKILAVDDDPMVLGALIDALKSEYSVFSATDGQSALAIMEEENIALVISDQKMAGMTGIELMEEFAKRYPDTVRIIITGYVEDELFMDAINVGHIYGFIAKPWKLNELRATVRKGIHHYEKTQILREPHVRALLHGGILSMEQLESIFHANSKSQKSIGEILVEQGIVPATELKTATKLGKIEHKELHEVLIERGIISESDLEMAFEQQRREKKSLTRTLTEMEYADEDSILGCYALHLGIPYIPLTQFPVRKHLARMLSARLAYKHAIVPVDSVAQTIVVAASEPLSESAKLDIEEETGKRVMTILAKRRDIEEALGQYYAETPPLTENPREEPANQTTSS